MGRTGAIILASAVLLAVVFYQLYTSMGVNNGLWIYPLDDAYIHMSMAKNLSHHGVWGITEYEFSSSSSSILYTLFISLCFKIFGMREMILLAVNLLAGMSILFVLWTIFKRENIHPLVVLLLTLILLFFTPLPAMILSGMEHTLQILIDLVFIYLAVLCLESEELSRKKLYGILAFAALSVMIRFEGVFLVSIISGFFLLKRKYGIAFLIAFAGLLPLVIFGIYSVQHGSYFIPNSLLMKGEKPSLTIVGIIQYIFGWLDKLKRNPHVLVLFCWMAAHLVYLSWKGIPVWNRRFMMVLILLGLMVIHLTFAKTGWFFRYEAYLVFLGLLSFVWSLNEMAIDLTRIKTKPLLYLGMVLLLLPSLYPLYARSKDALVMTVPATRNIFEQQYQMAMFLKKYYNNAEVAANDIGAICYFTDIKLLDIFGLASREVIALRMKKEFDQKHIYELSLSKHSKVAIIYASWFIGKVPEQWKVAGAWTVSDNVILGGDAVTFYATEKYDVGALKKNLKDFSKYLPRTVRQGGEYITSK